MPYRHQTYHSNQNKTTGNATLNDANNGLPQSQYHQNQVSNPTKKTLQLGRQYLLSKTVPPNASDPNTMVRPAPGGGYLTRFWMGTCHHFKNIPIPYTNFCKLYTWLYINFSKIHNRLYTNFLKMHTQPYTNCESWKSWYRSLYQDRENWYPSRWHVPVPKICILPPPPPWGTALKTTVKPSMPAKNSLCMLKSPSRTQALRAHLLSINTRGRQLD